MSRYLLDEEPDWLTEDIGQYQDEFLIVDLPGQIEIYTHYNIVPRLASLFSGANYGVLGVYVLDATFVLDPRKYFGALLNATCAMLNLGIPHLNVMTKIDLLAKLAPDMVEDESFGEDFGEEGHPLHAFLFPSPADLLSCVQQPGSNIDREKESIKSNTSNHEDDGEKPSENNQKEPKSQETLAQEKSSPEGESILFKADALTKALVQVLDEFDMVSFLTLDIRKEESIGDLLSHIDHAVQFGEMLEPKDPLDDNSEQKLDQDDDGEQDDEKTEDYNE